MSQLLSAPAANVSLVIFGFDAKTTRVDVEMVLCRCGVSLQGVWADLQVDLLCIPGDNDQAYAHVQHLPDRLLACRVADGLNARRHQGRRLQSWVPVMAWS
jgi:hypothetical protein